MPKSAERSLWTPIVQLQTAEFRRLACCMRQERATDACGLPVQERARGAFPEMDMLSNTWRTLVSSR